MRSSSGTLHPAQRAQEAIRPGHSLPAYYYLSEERYIQDIEILTDRSWLLAGHECRIPTPGDYFLFEFGGESVIVIRSNDGQVRAFYNVCRHRGSRLCLQQAGHASRLVCPYHAWTYGTDGRLMGSQDMPASFDKSEYGLKPCQVGCSDGLIFISLKRHDAPSTFEAFAARLKPFLAPYRLDRTKIIAEDRLACPANWKLVVENFAECYHCPSAHKTYGRVHRLDTMLYWDVDADEAGWLRRLKRNGLYLDPLFDAPSEYAFQGAIRLEIGGESVSGGITGKPLAPLLGDLKAWSGSWTGVSFNPLCQIGCYDDHVIVFRFLPRGPRMTDCIVTWMVREDAVEGKDFCVNDVAHMWRITLNEDKTICANNQLGVCSAAYQPGPYSRSESRAADTANWYVHHFVEAVETDR